jgi:hypothetical protein
METPTEHPFPLSDLALSRRLERTEARANADFVEARASAYPDSGAEWMEVAGAYAMFDGVASPLTQTFGLGLFQTATAADFERIEAFYQNHQAPVFHEVSPLADPAMLTLLNERGYQPMELTSVMFRPLRRDTSPVARNDKITVRLIEDREHELWAQTAAKGWSDSVEISEFMLDLFLISAKRAVALSFIAELEGEPIATGSLCLSGGVALLAGASTIPEGRKQGAQASLLDIRLRYAAEQSCDLAMMCASPGSASQRNAERQGFRIAYTRIKWRLAQAQA